MDNLLVEHDTGEILIIDLRSITNCLLEMLFQLRKSVKIDSADMKHLCFNFLSIPLVSHRHTCGPAHRLGEAASFDKLFFFLPPFSLNTTSSCSCRYVLRERERVYPGAALMYEILL